MRFENFSNPALCSLCCGSLRSESIALMLCVAHRRPILFGFCAQMGISEVKSISQTEWDDDEVASMEVICNNRFNEVSCFGFCVMLYNLSSDEMLAASRCTSATSLLDL